MINEYPYSEKYLDTDTGLVTPIKGHRGSSHVMDHLVAVGQGKVTGLALFRAVGRRSGLATTSGGDDIWEGAATNFVYPDQTVGERMTLVSTHANDATAGSGVQSVDVHYLDAAGNSFVETVALSGITPVHTTATNIRFKQYMHSSLTATGSIGTVAAGDITIYRYGDATRVYGVIKAGGNMSLSSQRMIPNGKTFYMTNIKADAMDNKPVSIRLRATCNYEGILLPGIFIYNELFELYNSGQSIEFKVPRKFPALSIIKGTAVSTTVGGTCSLSYEGWIE